MDCMVKSWMYSTLFTELADSLTDRGCMAPAAWLVVQTQFIWNRKRRALYLDA